jgi:hypothetical protein
VFSPYDLTADHFVAFVSEQRALIDEARRGSSTAREKLCSLVYVIARIQLHEGMPGDEIRTRLLEQSSETIGALTFDQGPRIADVAQAIEDALARRPPKYPQWINLAALADLEPRDKPAV